MVFEDLELDPAASVQVVHSEDAIAAVLLRVPLATVSPEDDPWYRTGPDDSRPATAAGTVAAIPYFLWANRAAGPMRVWIPLAVREA